MASNVVRVLHEVFIGNTDQVKSLTEFVESIELFSGPTAIPAGPAALAA